MNEKTGLNLIESLKNDPEKFYNEGKSYQLLQEYYKGLPKDTLRSLFYFESKWIRRAAVWITSELGENGIDLLKEVLTQINDSDHYICGYALQIVAAHACNEYIDDFIKVFSFLEHSNQKIRFIVMDIISGLSVSRIQEACEYSENKKLLSDSHKKGLLSLLNINTLALSEITKMIDSDDAVIRKYGVIIAEKLYKKYPQIINEAVNVQDLDISEFSKIVVETKIQLGQLISNEKSLHEII